MELFYSKDISNGGCCLDGQESNHCVKVLRHRKGEIINVIDGVGNLYKCEITDDSPKELGFKVIERIEGYGSHPYRLHVAVAPPKNIDRFEWFAEKATEIGVDEITPIFGDYSERKVFKKERAERIIVSAAKQSHKGAIPTLNDAVTVREFILKHSSTTTDQPAEATTTAPTSHSEEITNTAIADQPAEATTTAPTSHSEEITNTAIADQSAEAITTAPTSHSEEITNTAIADQSTEAIASTLTQRPAESIDTTVAKHTEESTFTAPPLKLICYCDEVESLGFAPKKPITNLIKEAKDIIVMIGPEGDFSRSEIELALRNGWQAVSLGDSRLRIETAALTAVSSIYLANI